MASQIEHIYHFANLDEGIPILKTYKDNSYKQNVHFIFSTIHHKKTSINPIKYIYHKLTYYKYVNKIKNLLSKTSASILFEDDVNSQEFIQRISPKSIMISSGFTQIFKSQLIDKFEGAYNIHQSLLPLYKGPVPNYWVLKNNETQTGFTIHKITEVIDDGDIIYQEIYNIDTYEPSTLQISIANQIAHSFRSILKSIIEEKEIEYEKIDPEKIYKTHISYKGFPTTE